MANLKEELVRATVSFDAEKILNEAEVKTMEQIAKELGTSKQNIYMAIQNGMDKIYKKLKKDHKATPAQAVKILMDFWNTDAKDIIQALSKDVKKEVEDYVRTHGAY